MLPDELDALSREPDGLERLARG